MVSDGRRLTVHVAPALDALAGDDAPRCFFIGARRVEAEDVVDRWLAADHRYYKLLASDGTYILRHDLPSGRWELTVYDSGRGDGRSLRACQTAGGAQ